MLVQLVGEFGEEKTDRGRTERSIAIVIEYARPMATDSSGFLSSPRNYVECLVSGLEREA